MLKRILCGLLMILVSVNVLMPLLNAQSLLAISSQYPSSMDSGNDSSTITTEEEEDAFNPTSQRYSKSEDDVFVSDRCLAQLVIRVNDKLPDAYARLMDTVSKYGGEVINTVSVKGLVIAVIVEIPSVNARLLARDVSINGLSAYIEHRVKFQAQVIPNDPYWNLQWGPQKIEADWAWNTTIGDPSVLVAVIDTGIDWDHPDLAANYVALGYDWVNDDPDPMDDNGHGTHCAGIIAAVINNSIGVAGLAQVRIMAEKGLNYEGEGYEDWLANAIIHAVDQGADILSLSWGSYEESELIHEAIKYAYDNEVLVIAAAGNDATSSEEFPAAFPEVIAVTATDEYDALASWTNYGDWVELAAPGVNIYSTVWNDDYAYKSGTSMAAPHVAGVAALAWSRFPNASRDWVRHWLWNTADDLGAPGFDVYYGYGRINARRAVQEVPPEHDLLILDLESPPYVKVGEPATFNATILNFGISNESNIEVQLLVNSSLIDSVYIDFLSSGALALVGLSWTPTVEGTYNVTSYVVPVPGETATENNVITKIVTVIAPPPEENWILLATDPDEGTGTNLKAIYGQLYSDIVYFKVEHYRVWATINDIDTGIFIDADQDPSTGLPDGSYPDQNTGIGADYVIVVGFQGTQMWRWDPAAQWWDIFNPIQLAYLDALENSNIFVVGIYLADIGDFQIIDCAVADVPSNWDWMPDTGHITWTLIRYEHDLTVFLEAPTFLQPGEASLLNATVYNIGLNNETNVEVQLLINGTIVNNVTISELPVGASYALNYLWTPTTEGRYNITAYVPPVPNENVTTNNIITRVVCVRYVDVALISDNSELLAITSILDSMGIGYDIYNDNSIYLYTENLDLLLNYKAVIFNNHDRPITSDEHSALQSYLSLGGNLLVTGYDSLGHPDDWLLADVVRSSSVGDNVGEPDLYVMDETHPIMNGIYGSFPVGYHISGLYDDCDAAQADPTRMAITVAELADGYDKIIATEGLPGKVVYWNGFGPDDWTWNGDCETMFKNIIAWFLIRFEHEIAVSLDVPTFLEPGGLSLINATVYNRGLSNESNVELQLLINGSIVDSIVIPELPVDSSYTLSYLWTPITEGTYNITAYVPPIPRENITANNIATKNVLVRFMKYVLWDDVHDGDGDSLTGNYLSLYQLLSSSGFIVDELTSGTITSELLANYDILVLIDPEYDFSSSEISAIHEWVLSGGGLIVIPDTGYPSTLNTIMALYGVQLTGVISDYGTTTNIVPHPITMNVESIYYDLAWELAVSPPSNTLAWTLEGYAFLSASAGGEMVVISDSNLMDNDGLGMADNTQLMLNIFNWIGVKYEHELTVGLEAPTFLELGESTLLNATVYNKGLNNETDVELFILINGTEVSSAVIPELLTEASYTLSYLWTPMTEGTYNVTTYAPPVPGENITLNNARQMLVSVKVLPDILIVNDDDGGDWVSGTSLIEFKSALEAAGYDYWVWNESSMGNPPLDFLLKFELVIWTCGDYWNWAVDPADAETLEAYLAQGGNILLEGEDIGYDHDADDFMINVAHAMYEVDDTGAPGLTVTDPSHPVTFNLPSSFNWLTDPPYDDGVSPTNGGAEVIQYTGTTWTAVTVFEGASSGSVVYYAFPLYCLPENERNTLAINSINWLLGIRYEHELAVKLDTPSFVEPDSSSLLNATVYNWGLSDETNVELQLLINGSIADSIVIPELLTETSYTLSYLWTPAIEGTYNVTAYALPTPGEEIIYNNVESKIVYVRFAKFVLWDDTHDDDGDDLYIDCSTFYNNLLARGYIVDQLSVGPIDSAILANYDILVIPDPEVALSSSEITDIQNFISTGGGLWILGEAPDFYDMESLNTLLAPYGIAFGITGLEGNITNMAVHPVTSGISWFYYQYGSDVSATDSAQLIAWYDTYGVLAVSEHIGKVAVIGDSNFLEDEHLQGDNLQLSLNIIDWLGIKYPPVANFTWSPLIPKVGELVTFDASASTPDGGTIVKYEWDFGDGETATGKMVSHTYANPGIYTVTLNVTDSQGLWDIEEKQIQVVQPHGPKANFTWTPETPKAGEKVLFNASSSLPGWNGTHIMPITEYRWNFGDGNTTTTTSPIVHHTYQKSGVYYVTLTVYAPGATPETDSITHKIIVPVITVGGKCYPIETTTFAIAKSVQPTIIATITIMLMLAITAKKKKKK